VRGGDSVVDGRYAGPKWDRPRSPPKERSKGLIEAAVGAENDSDDAGGYGASRWDLPYDTRARCSSMDTADGNHRFAGSKRNQAQSRLQYRSRRDLIEGVVEYGKEKYRFGLMSKSGGCHDRGSRKRERERVLCPAASSYEEPRRYGKGK
jgi:hypothetical protein